MTLAARRKIWRTREVSRYKKWHFFRFSSKRPAAERLRERNKWWGLYIAARDARRKVDKEIAKTRGGFHEVDDEGVNLVAEFEGFRANVYRDVVGVPTQGYGETVGLTPGRSWSEAYAKSRLRTRLNRDYAPAVVAANRKLKQNEGNGFTSFVYNVGVGGVARTTQVGRYLRSGNVRGAANAILAWSKAGGRTLQGLLSRRQRERALILR